MKELFSPQLKWTTLKLWLICFMANFVYYGVVFIVPFILGALNPNATGNDGIG